ncbi:MAG: N-acetylmuramoyl-L-alanine amidase [Clostridiaceae bacterium]|nr:N-acetylmuramoyl-L-alanine amidase [Clostridiaceae bacterium]
MNLTSLKFKKQKSRFRLVNTTRFIAMVLIFMLAITAVIVAIAKNSEVPSDQSSVAVTPEVLPTPIATPTPEPTPVIVVPEGKTMEPVIIVLDAGHGGRDPGTVSPYLDGFYEKEVTLDIAKKVKSLLNEKGIEVVMTREGEDHLNDNIEKDLKARASVANEANASLFVSIHVNAYEGKGAASVNGMEVYYLNKEPVYTDFTEEEFAKIVGDEIKNATEIKFNGTISRPLAVLRHTLMPAILIETGYITNKEDHDRLLSQDFRNKTAQGIAKGIEITLDKIGAFEHDGALHVFKEVGE